MLLYQVLCRNFYLQFNVMFATMGYASAAGLLAALSGGIGFVCTGLCLVYGKKWRASLE